MAVQDGQDRSVPSAHLAIRCDFADQAHDPRIPRPSWRITDRLEKSIRRADLFKRASNVGLVICPLGNERRRYHSEVAMRIVSTLGTLILMSFAVPATVEAGRTAPYFAFHNSFWMNLHQTLFHEANLRKLPAEKHARFDPSSLPDAPLSTGEHEAWNTAVTYYAEKFAGRLQVFDDELIGISAALTASSDSADSPLKHSRCFSPRVGFATPLAHSISTARLPFERVVLRPYLLEITQPPVFASLLHGCEPAARKIQKYKSHQPHRVDKRESVAVAIRSIVHPETAVP